MNPPPPPSQGLDPPLKCIGYVTIFQLLPPTPLKCATFRSFQLGKFENLQQTERTVELTPQGNK